MKKSKYTLIVFAIISFSVSSFTPNQSGELRFLEAYTYGEFSSTLEADDPFFQLISTEDRSAEGSKLGFCPEAKISETLTYLNSTSFLNQFPKDLKFAWGADQGIRGKYLYALKESKTAYNGPGKSDIKEVDISDDLLLISFTGEGSRKWEELTRASLGKPIAIVINDLVYSAPMVREVIKAGKCAISGNFSKGDLAELKAVLEN